MSWEKKPQNLANHSRIVPPYHYGLTLVVLAIVGIATWRTFADFSIDRLLMVLTGIALIGIFWYSRIFPLAAQDRVIVLETKLRLAQLLPGDLTARIGELHPGQLIALRFAGDDELAELTRRTLDDSLSRADIKKQIRNWRPDYHRV